MLWVHKEPSPLGLNMLNSTRYLVHLKYPQLFDVSSQRLICHSENFEDALHLLMLHMVLEV